MTSLSGYSEIQIDYLLRNGALPNVIGFECFKDRFLAELYVNSCKLPRKHNQNINMNSLKASIQYHPDLVDTVVKNIDHTDILEQFLMKEIIAEFNNYALYINVLNENGYVGKYYSRPDLFKAMANHKEGCDYILDHLQEVLENPKVNIDHYMDAFKKIISLDLPKIYLIVPKLNEFKHYTQGSYLVEHAVRENEEFAREMIDVTEESPLIPKYSQRIGREYMGVIKSLKEQVHQIRILSAYHHLSVAKLFLDSKSTSILVSVIHHPELQKQIAWSKTIDDRQKSLIIRNSRNIQFANLLKNSFDFYVLLECIMLSAELKKYILSERKNLSPKLKNWLQSKTFERQDAIDFAHNRDTNYKHTVKSNLRTRPPARSL